MRLDAERAAVVVAVVPAAGQSTRFGSMKLLADVDGVPLIARTLRALLDAGMARVIVVTRQEETFAAVRLRDDTRVTVVRNPDPDRGMFSSIQAGLAVAHADVVLVLPADMPFVPPATIAAVAARAVATGSVVIPAHQTRRGHPIAMPGSVCEALRALVPTTTLKEAIAASGASIDVLDVAEAGVLRDVDVPDDLGR